MSDGMSEGYRWAREHDARQKTIDEFFVMVLAQVTNANGAKIGRTRFRKAFDAFDAHRHADNIARHRIEKERGKRWEAFLSLIDDITGDQLELRSGKAWAEILSLALRFATPGVTQCLHEASTFRTCRIALYVPNGTGHYGRNAPTILGDLEGALDTLADRPFNRPGLCVIIVEDPDRAVVGLTLGPDGGEKLEPERAKLRFLAVEKS